MLKPKGSINLCISEYNKVRAKKNKHQITVSHLFSVFLCIFTLIVFSVFSWPHVRTPRALVPPFSLYPRAQLHLHQIRAASPWFHKTHEWRMRVGTRACLWITPCLLLALSSSGVHAARRQHLQQQQHQREDGNGEDGDGAWSESVARARCASRCLGLYRVQTSPAQVTD